MLATLNKLWGIGTFTERDKVAAPIDYVFTRETARAPADWSVPDANPVPQSQLDWEQADKTLSGLGKSTLPGIIAVAKRRRASTFHPRSTSLAFI